MGLLYFTNISVCNISITVPVLDATNACLWAGGTEDRGHYGIPWSQVSGDKFKSDTKEGHPVAIDQADTTIGSLVENRPVRFVLEHISRGEFIDPSLL